MSTPESTSEDSLRAFGPHPSPSTGPRLDPGAVPDRTVKTHCCFCGQQCGITLLVKDEEVIGFEPWMEFPVQPGQALSQGRQALSAGRAPRPSDHRLSPRIPGSPGGFRGHRLRRSDSACGRGIQTDSGRNTAPTAFAVLSGASLTIEKAYLMGKFARVCLKTPNIDYNGRLCMVSRRRGEQEGVRHRSRGQSHGRHPRAPRSSGSAEPTSPSARRSRPTTSGRRARTARKVIVVDPRITPIARTCDLFLPSSPAATPLSSMAFCI